MEALMKILKSMDDSVAWEEEKALIDDRILDSFGVISLVAELEDEFGIEIEAVELSPENFNSVEALWNMIMRLRA